MGEYFPSPQNSQRMNLYGPLIFGKGSRGLLGLIDKKKLIGHKIRRTVSP